MGNKTTNSDRKGHRTGHKWVLYSNPRNGRIQVTACKHCGTMLAGVRASKPCTPKQSKNSMESIGWITDSQATKEQAQNIKADI